MHFPANGVELVNLQLIFTISVHKLRFIIEIPGYRQSINIEEK